MRKYGNQKSMVFEIDTSGLLRGKSVHCDRGTLAGGMAEDYAAINIAYLQLQVASSEGAIKNWRQAPALPNIRWNRCSNQNSIIPTARGSERAPLSAPRVPTEAKR